jgi:hypothetical protein
MIAKIKAFFARCKAKVIAAWNKVKDFFTLD